MLCPEVWNFAPPPSSVSTKLCETEEEVFQTIGHQYFNHHVSLTLPNTIQLPNDIINTALEDSQFYRVNKVPVAELLKKEFVELFVTKGRLTVRSLNDISEPDSLVVTPCGKLIVSLSKSTFQKLGIESSVTKQYKTYEKKYFLVLDLSSKSNDVKKKCEQVQKKFSSNSNLCLDIVLVWEPNSKHSSSNICPSSIAYYFYKKGYFVKTCDIFYKHKLKYNIAVPTINDESEPSELIEWLGAFGLECDTQSDNHISTMVNPEGSEVLGQVMQLSFTGLISHNRLKSIISQIRSYITAKTPLVWISLTVHGFHDSILNMENKHLILSNGDHHLTVFFRWNHPSLVYRFQDKNR